MACSNPVDFSQTVLSPTAINMNWTSAGVPGETYNIYFPDSLTLNNTFPSGPISIGTLQPFTTYSISIACSNSVDLQTQTSITAYTLPDEVSAITISGSTSNSFQLLISGVACDYYSVTASPGVEQTFSYGLLTLDVTGLTPATTYSGITVAACSTILNECGVPLTILDTVTTLPAALPPIVNAPSITLQNFFTVLSDQLDVEWAPTGADTTSITWQTLIGGPIQDDSTTLTQYSILSLETGTSYKIAGQSFYTSDTTLYSSSVYITSFTTTPDPVFYLFQYGSSSNNILLSFTSQSTPGSDPNISSYSLEVSSATSNFTYTIPATTNLVNAIGLDPLTTYIASISSCVVNTDFLNGSTPYLNCTPGASMFVYTAPGSSVVAPIVDAPSITLQNFSTGQSTNQLNLNWAPVLNSNITSVSWQSLTGGSILNASTALTTYTIPSLATGTTYKISGQTYYNSDTTLYSSSIYTTSFTTLPAPMTDLFQYASGTNNIYVSFSSLSTVSNPNISSYSLVLPAIPIKISVTTNSYNITGLNPSTAYIASLSACVVNTDYLNANTPYLNCGTSFVRNISTAPTSSPVVNAPSITLQNFVTGQSTNQLNLQWAPTLADYASITWQSITGGTVLQTSTALSLITLSSLATGTTYKISGQSYYTSDTTLYSSSVYITSFTTLPDPMTDLFQYASGSNNIFVSFTSLSLVSDPNISSYSLLLSGPVPFIQISVSTNSYNITGLNPLTSYIASISACVVNTDYLNASTPYLNCGISYVRTINSGPGSVLTPPQLFAIQSTSNLIVLGSSSGGAGATSYSLLIDELIPVSFSRFPFSVTNLTYNTLYSFTANSTDINNVGSAYGNSITVRTLNALSPPQPIISSVSDTFINFYWTAVPGAAGYNIQVSNPFTNDIVATTNYKLIGLFPSTTYQVSFASVDVWGTIGPTYTNSYQTSAASSTDLSTSTIVIMSIVAALGGICALILIYFMSHSQGFM